MTAAAGVYVAALVAVLLLLVGTASCAGGEFRKWQSSRWWDSGLWRGADVRTVSCLATGGSVCQPAVRFGEWFVSCQFTTDGPSVSMTWGLMTRW
jgi:hypothetical protein